VVRAEDDDGPLQGAVSAAGLAPRVDTGHAVDAVAGPAARAVVRRAGRPRSDRSAHRGAARAARIREVAPLALSGARGVAAVAVDAVAARALRAGAAGVAPRLGAEADAGVAVVARA